MHFFIASQSSSVQISKTHNRGLFRRSFRSLTFRSGSNSLPVVAGSILGCMVDGIS